MSKQLDPHAAREAEKYDNPVPSREFILQTLIDLGRPVGYKDVCAALKVDDEERIEGVRRRLIAMSRDAQIDNDRSRDQYFPLDPTKIAKGIVQGHRDGYGFLLRDEGEDVYLSNNQMRKVFHGDEVIARITGTDRRGRLEGRIARVVSANTQTIIGRFFDQTGSGMVKPDNKRVAQEIIIPPEHRNGAQHDQFVNVEIIHQPRPGKMPIGRVAEVVGDNMAPGMEIEVAIRSHDIPNEWSNELLKELENIPTEVEAKDKKKRIDLRKLPFVTIDGEDAKDFDDAVFVERNKRTNGWRLYVAIADVSHYVNVDSELDKEAVKRATSVYFPENVVPMLPEAISNGLCSLNPEVDRLVMVCEMTISEKGKVSGYKFQEGIIHSHARLTYSKVWEMLQRPLSDAGKEWRKFYRPVVPHVEELYKLFKVLRKVRDARGAIDFETTETKIEFNSQRKIEQIIPTDRNHAHMLIEECMLCANVCAADFLERYKVPGLYRVHNGPSDQKLENLRAFLGEIGLSIGGGDKPDPKHFQALLESIKKRPDAHLIQTVMLRSLSQAVYQPENEGHFGLAFDAYAHFTSPIRRYPDLLVHRGIRSVIRSARECKHIRRVEGAGRLTKKKIFPYDTAAMVSLGEHCSMAERRADDATRDVVDFLKCEYMQQHVGEVFEGVISAVTNFGLFVELKDVFVEGLIHVSNLNNDFYQFDAVKHRLIGERTRRSFRLGDKLWVQVSGVELDDRKISFSLATAPGNEDRAQAIEHAANPPANKVRRRPAKNKAATSADGSANNEGGTTKKGSAKEGSGNDKKTSAKKKKRSPSKRQKLNARKGESQATTKKANGKKTAAKKVKKRKPKKAPNAAAKK